MGNGVDIIGLNGKHLADELALEGLLKGLSAKLGRFIELVVADLDVRDGQAVQGEGDGDGAVIALRAGGVGVGIYAGGDRNGFLFLFNGGRLRRLVSGLCKHGLGIIRNIICHRLIDGVDGLKYGVRGIGCTRDRIDITVLKRQCLSDKLFRKFGLACLAAISVSFGKVGVAYLDLLNRQTVQHKLDGHVAAEASRRRAPCAILKEQRGGRLVFSRRSHFSAGQLAVHRIDRIDNSL